jgi:peroxiredoxin
MTASLIVLLLSFFSRPGVPAGESQTTVKAALQDSSDRKPAPTLELLDAAGKAVRLSAFIGEPVIVNLWATECAGCKAELPVFIGLHRTYASQGLKVIGVSMDVMYEGLKSVAEGWTRVKPFAASHELPYTIVVDDGSVEKAYNVMAMPATYLIDRKGRIAATYIGIVNADDLTANLKRVIAEAK